MFSYLIKELPNSIFKYNMSHIPFKKFIISLLLFNKDTSYIINKLKTFGYYITEEEIVDILHEIRSMLPSTLTDIIDSKRLFDTSDEVHSQWLKIFDVFEYYDFILRKDTEKNPPNYFNWCENCLWIHSHQDVMCLINILMFNDETDESISDVIMLKYKKKLGIETLKLYRKTFWDTDNLTAYDALERCIPFKDNTLVIRKMRSGESEICMNEASNNGSDVPVTSHSSNYLKWKVGYKNIEIPTAKEFLEQIKKDSYFKYYEVMNMTQSTETEDEDGSNNKFGIFDRKLKRQKNTEEERVKLAKNWIEIFLKANDAMPEGGSHTKGFFEKMQQLELDFEEAEDEKIVRIEDTPEILSDIKSDISP